MKNKITRKDKKKLRAIILCHTGNPECRSSQYGKEHWLKLKIHYDVWFKLLGIPGHLKERKNANSVRFKNSK